MTFINIISNHSDINFQKLGETIGDFFVAAIQQGLIKSDQIHFFGFCYSSQLSGFIARHISSKTNKQKIKSISGQCFVGMNKIYITWGEAKGNAYKIYSNITIKVKIVNLCL